MFIVAQCDGKEANPSSAIKQEGVGRVDVARLIFSEQFGERSFNLQIPERLDCLSTLFARAHFAETIREREAGAVSNCHFAPMSTRFLLDAEGIGGGACPTDGTFPHPV